MRKLWFIPALIVIALIPAFAQGPTVGPSPLYCNQVLAMSQGSSAITQVIPNVTNKQISLCGWAFSSTNATSSVLISKGSGTNCGTGTAGITPTITLPSNGAYVDHNSTAALSLDRSTDVCVTTAGTGPTQILIYYGIN